MNFIDYKTPLDSFIGGWVIDRKICEDLIKFFETNKKRQVEGKIGGAHLQRVDTKVKKSTDICMYGADTAFDKYNESLQGCLEKYMQRYPEVRDKYANFNTTFEGYNTQKYEPGGGFYNWHCERDCKSTRCLVFMTYLNDVNEGGTEFKYQKLITPAKCGLTLIWPTDFTHMHRGVISPDETKYIITGWYNFV